VALIVVSNRVAMGSPDEPAAGGVAGALHAALDRAGGTWIGWSGRTAEEGEERVRSLVEEGISYRLIDLARQDYDEYYAGFANRALWPMMHYRLGLTAFSQDDLVGYLRVNTAFARQVAAVASPGDAIWVHDYHLMPLAAQLRSLGCRQRIGYFHHIPWPPPEVFSCLPGARLLLAAMTEYDVVGLQTATDVEHFGQCLRRELGARDASGLPAGPGSRARRRFTLGGRATTVVALPIGVDARAFGRMARRAASDPVVAETIASLGGRDMIIGVDRLDYSKGVAQRMEAYAGFLEREPERRGTVEYLQITPLSRADIPEYEAINHEVAETAGRISGALGEASWTPIRYVNRAYSREILAGLYRAARVGLVTPMRDGMNLVAKEFVAAQDGRNPGVLVLSRFAGAARQMKSALIVNPFDRSAVMEALRTALAMPLAERQARWRKLRETVLRQDVGWWVDRNMAELAGDALGDEV
jgi:trehalose 6-phosphate synthase